MLERLQNFLDALGNYQEAADYLGYTTRQLYNIRKSLEQGKALQRHVEVYITRMIDQYEPQKQVKRKGHRKNAQSETTQQSRRYSDAFVASHENLEG